MKEETKSVALNTLELDIHTTKISVGGSETTSQPDVSYNEASQVTTIKFDKALQPGEKAQICQTFTGYLNDKMAGFYRSSYKLPDGNTKYLATTQMEPTDARRAFPCFDEPALKAEFTITLVADKAHTCLSNMDQASEKQVDSKITGGKRKAVTFNKTPLMSTYLLAFIVGDLKCIETNDFRVPVRVFAPPSSDIEHGRFSLELAAKTLDFYEKEFDSKFPLPKMDMVAIPDFSAGAMENWGLVTYRVVDLLFDEKTSGASTKERVAEVVQHELAHQWFGNLVTMDFWDGLWLNEGFATWMSWYSCNKFYPSWKVWQNYVTDTLQGALSLDSLRSSHPIEVPVKRADEINQIFDAISYSKGSCVLRMISKYLGEETFMEGIRRYLKKHAYGNTQTKDLWAALSDASGKDVEKVMDIWTKNIGYPVVTVTENKDSIHVQQNRFLRTGDVKPEEDQTLYPVFLGLRTKSGVDETLTLSTRETNLSVPFDPTSDESSFYKLNADHSGLYRTAYPPSRLSKLGRAAKDGLLTVEDRAGMLADATALASSGYQSTPGLLSLLQNLDQEPEFVVWSQILSSIAALRAAWVFEPDPIREALKTFQRTLVSPLAHKKGWSFPETPTDDNHLESQFKALLFGSAGLAGDETIISAARDMFSAYFSDGNKSAIHPNIRASVYAIALRYGGEKEWDALFQEYKTSADADRRNTALRALGRAHTPELIHKTLSLPLSDDVKGQDIYLPIASLRNTPAGIDSLWEWMTSNWSAIEKKAPPGLSMLSSLVQMCSSGFTSKEKEEEVKAWFAGRSTKGFDRAVEQSLDGVRAKAGWVGREREGVEGWLREGGYLK